MAEVPDSTTLRRSVSCEGNVCSIEIIFNPMEGLNRLFQGQKVEF